MYVGVDVGGTKTLLAVLNEHGEIRHSVKFPTSQNYDHFLLELRNAYHHLPTQEFKAGAVGIPAVLIDREHGRGKIFGNLAWKNVPIQHDLERIFHCPFVVENDAKLAGLSEAMLLRDKYEKVLYVTVSTGIGYALINSGEIDKNIGDGGGKEILLPHRGKHVPWESYASGHALLKDELQRYHLPLLPLPELRKAERPEEAVVYGCYDIAKQTFGHATVNQ
jgi:predicted NBD/HSP70 family sugar kinase